MEESRCLVITCGFFGDILFATSIADKLKSEQGFAKVDYLIGFPQMTRLVENNPAIDQVYTSMYPSPKPVSVDIDISQYTKVIQLQSLNYQVPPSYEYQQFAGIKNPSPSYNVFTEPIYDEVAKTYVNELKQDGRKVIAVMSNWESKTYLFTPDQYIAGIDVPNLGYGGSHRDIPMIVQKLQEEFNIIEVGVPPQYNQQLTATIGDDDQKSVLFEASLMKFCDAFIGTDGGLATIAAGVGTKTIITGDFNLQLYGWNGVIKKIEQPRLGPYEYFGNPHIVLDPYFSDEQLTQAIINNLT